MDVMAIGSMVIMMPVNRRFEHRHGELGLFGQHRAELPELMVESLVADKTEAVDAAIADCD